MTTIIRLPRPRREPDPYLTPITGTRGPCALCGNYSDLTQNHVPPEGVGNVDTWIAQSYLTGARANPDLYRGRQFRGGIRFRTLCRDCNNSLGRSEDRALISFYSQVRRLLASPLTLPRVMRVPARPNLIMRGLLAHIASANENGIPTPFDQEARDIFLGKQALRLCSWNLFYWLYLGEEIFVMRSAFLTRWSPTVEVNQVYLLKCAPLAFMFSRDARFHGVPNMLKFVQNRDQDEAELPILLNRRETASVWPAMPLDNQIILLASPSFGFVAKQN